MTEHHSDFVSHLAKIYKPKIYVELGLYEGETLKKVQPHAKKCYGVDIKLNQHLQELGKLSNVSICNETTDEFFKNYKDDPIDMIFIDADHKYSSAFLDFQNSLKFLAPNGIVIFHDTDPVEDKYINPMLCGDSYKLVELLENHPEFNIVTLPIAEAGLSVVTRKNSTRVISRNANSKEWKAIVLGSKGMLGNYIYKYFKSVGADVVGLTRNEIDVKSCTRVRVEEVLKNFTSSEKKNIIINCIGLIKPSGGSPMDYSRVNSLFPHILESICLENGWKLIHPSTDCVFGGRGKYLETDLSDAEDVYGVSKLSGEPIHSTVIRVSIIGEELVHKYSLLEWFRTNKGGKCKGFTNHLWNGITCLEYAKVIEKIIKGNLFWKGPRHIYSPRTVTKYELLKIINEVYDLRIEIEQVETKEPCDKTLFSIYKMDFGIPDLMEQIKEMKEFKYD